MPLELWLVSNLTALGAYLNLPVPLVMEEIFSSSRLRKDWLLVRYQKPNQSLMGSVWEPKCSYPSLSI